MRAGKSASALGIKTPPQQVILYVGAIRPVWLSRRRRARQFEETALPHLADVYRFARQLADEEQAQDLVQDTYLRAWKYFDSFQAGTNCRAWLFRILHNVWTDRFRQSRLELSLNEQSETAIEPYYDWEDEFMREELSAELEQALAQLPEAYRWAVLLADVEELSYQEIAQVMDCPIGTVMSRINRGRRTLARLLRATEQSEPQAEHKRSS
ncbi:MAG: RNA polymerase subunit sigma-24 [Acidobacteria bacterium]|nr:MAG: RNA polymerase subunit sigma-24 [Acidobacteriota bacterium]